MMQYTMLWEGKMSKTLEIQSTKKDRGVGTVYQIRAELIAAAIVSIFGIILVVAANVFIFGNISSCYHPQAWLPQGGVE